MKSTKLDHAIIKFLLKEGCYATKIHQRLVAVYGDSAPNYCTVTRWFNDGCQSMEDDPRPPLSWGRDLSQVWGGYRTIIAASNVGFRF